MAGHVDQVDVNDAMFSASTFSVKEEQCQEDTFVEDKVCISETAMTIDNAELQGPICHGKIKQYEESTCLNNIKTELPSFQAIEVQNANVKIEGGSSADYVKIEFGNGLLYCEHCKAYYVDYCIECGMLVHILNRCALNNADSRVPEDIPNDILEIQDRLGQTGIYSLRIIPAGVKFGPFIGLSAIEWPWGRNGEKFVLDKNKSKYLNWMQYINPTRNISEQNLHVFQCKDNVYYQSTRQIQAGEELSVYFGEENEDGPNKILIVDFVATTNEIVKDVFACTFCCLGFSSKSYLAKHKNICQKDAAETFPIEELKQCPFCKIHLDPKEYFEHHINFCSKRNARKSILTTPPAKEATTALNEPKRSICEIYKCDQCKYMTKYQTDLKQHTKQHSRVKIYKCRTCNRSFKTRKSLRLHMENTHSYIGGKNDPEHSTTDYRNTLIKVEQSNSGDQNRIFKCTLCVFQARYKQSLTLHIKAKHLKQFTYKCGSCEFRTNRKHHLKVHVKTKHLKKFDHKCDSCKYGTNNKADLTRHIKTMHLKQFDYKCGKCEFRTQDKGNFETHMKTKHLKQFDFKCDLCEFRTNNKSQLEVHIKTKHLKAFDYNCHFCEYGTNVKSNVGRHIKALHLKKSDYKCDLCEFGTNIKTNLKRHIKTIHLKEFDYKCDSCDYRTNIKRNLDYHVKSTHLKLFDFKCDKCEFGANRRDFLEIHMKRKHL